MAESPPPGSQPTPADPEFAPRARIKQLEVMVAEVTGLSILEALAEIGVPKTAIHR